MPDTGAFGSPYFYGGPWDGLQEYRVLPIEELYEVEDSSGTPHRYRNSHTVTPRGCPIYLHESIRKEPWT